MTTMTPVQTHLNRTLAHSNLDYDTKIGTDGGEKGRWREEFSFLFLFLFCLCDSPSLLFASWLLCYLLFAKDVLGAVTCWRLGKMGTPWGWYDEEECR